MTPGSYEQDAATTLLAAADRKISRYSRMSSSLTIAASAVRDQGTDADRFNAT